MASRQTDHPEGLTTYSTGAGSTGWWAIALLIMIESTVFAGLIASYFYLFSNATAWPPEGIEQPELLVPTIYSVILLASVIPAYVSDRALSRGDIGGMRLWRAIGGAMLVVFLVIKGWEYSHLDYLWDDNVYGSMIWIIAGFHSAHVLVVLIKTITTQTLAWKGFFNERRRSAVQGETLYWLFVVTAWVPLYATVYLFPNYAQMI